MDTGETFAWLVWVEVSAEGFLEMSDLWTEEGREKKAAPYAGSLANNLAIYQDSTLGLSVTVQTRPIGVRPFVEVLAQHQLRNEQRQGITLHRVQEIYPQ
jgi:hypothetical protein